MRPWRADKSRQCQRRWDTVTLSCTSKHHNETLPSVFTKVIVANQESVRLAKSGHWYCITDINLQHVGRGCFSHLKIFISPHECEELTCENASGYITQLRGKKSSVFYIVVGGRLTMTTESKCMYIPLTDQTKNVSLTLTLTVTLLLNSTARDSKH